MKESKFLIIKGLLLAFGLTYLLMCSIGQGQAFWYGFAMVYEKMASGVANAAWGNPSLF